MLNHWILLLTNYEGLGPPPESSVITQEDGGFLLQEDGGQIWTDAPSLSDLTELSGKLGEIKALLESQQE